MKYTIAIIAALILFACSGSEPTPSDLVPLGGDPCTAAITCDLSDGARLSTTDDISSERDGLQLLLPCHPTCFGRDDVFELSVENTSTGSVVSFTQPYDGSGTITFGPITLMDGRHLFTVVDKDALAETSMRVDVSL